MSARAAFTGWLQRAMAPVLACALVALSASADGQGVAMVTDLEGRATSGLAGRWRPLTILDELDTGTVVQLEAGSTLVALYLEGGDEYLFSGPARIEFMHREPEMQQGAKPQRRNLALARSVRIQPVGVAQGGMVMRAVSPPKGVRALAPNRTRTLETRPEFRWSGPQGVDYRFELGEEGGRTIFETRAWANSIALPASVTLRESVRYSWTVSAALPRAGKETSTAQFSIAPSELRAQAEALRPDASAPLSSQVAYAAWLDQVELRDEARKYWRKASEARPEDPRLRVLASP